MKVLHISEVLAVFLILVPCAFSTETVKLTWRSHGKSDNLVINGRELRYHQEEGYQTNMKRVNSFFPKNVTSKTPIIITIPIKRRWELRTPPPPPDWRSQAPRLDGFQLVVFTSFTSPERDVTYFYQGRKVRRYLLRLSSKGTAENPDDANYWLDGELLGNWEKAKDRLLNMQWDDNAVADIMFDISFIWTSSGAWLYIKPELETCFIHHHILVNLHQSMRADNDR